jgi:hypothetical protein
MPTATPNCCNGRVNWAHTTLDAWKTALFVRGSQSELERGDYAALPLTADKTRDVRLNLVCRDLSVSNSEGNASRVVGTESRTGINLVPSQKRKLQTALRAWQPIDEIYPDKAI